MARFKDPIVQSAFAPYLDTDETLQEWAYGVKQPSIWLMIPLFALAIVPGAIAVALLTKEYLVGVTDQRVLVLLVRGGKALVKEITTYEIGEPLEVEASSGAIFAHITVTDPERPFKAKFHRAGAPENRERALAAARALGAEVA